MRYGVPDQGEEGDRDGGEEGAAGQGLQLTPPARPHSSSSSSSSSTAALGWSARSASGAPRAASHLHRRAACQLDNMGIYPLESSPVERLVLELQAQFRHSVQVGAATPAHGLRVEGYGSGWHGSPSQHFAVLGHGPCVRGCAGPR